ncbi:MAG: YbaB/EbfC family nucleoid-associated protein [Alphaproteobacteria bacterium]|nr:YbaB/EbfC family nucleoid-associated protein [Alphaproteobacteria bacterium]MBR4806653.1 YbaB/EbfC family nucleoid-associated protein [Alphaproteobacteria bacterium]
MDMESLMAQATELQSKVAAAQEKLGDMHVKGIASGGACIIDMTGKYDIMSVTINPSVMDKGVAAVEEAVLSAMKDAKKKADNIIDDVMADATAGMPLPK